MTKSLAKYIHDYFAVEYESTEFISIYGNSVKYLLKAISAGELSKRVKRLSKRSVKVFRLGLCNEGYYLLNVKMWTITGYTKNYVRGSAEELDSFRSMEIMKKDRKYIPMFLKDRELRAQIKAIIFQLGGRKFIPTIQELKELLIEVMKEAEVKLRPLMNHLVWNKLKFLIQCGSVDMDSVKCELKAKIIQTFYWLAPYRKQSINHWVMSMIKPIKNHAINLINFYTTQKRTRLIEENGEYKSIEVVLDAGETETQIEDVFNHPLNMETCIAAKQVYRRYAITKKRIKAFKLLSGVYDEEFTDWLRQHKFISGHSNFDNTDYQDNTSGTLFLKLVAKFVRLKWDYFLNLILRIRKNLTEGGSGHYDNQYSEQCFAVAG